MKHSGPFYSLTENLHRKFTKWQCSCCKEPLKDEAKGKCFTNSQFAVVVISPWWPLATLASQRKCCMLLEQRLKCSRSRETDSRGQQRVKNTRSLNIVAGFFLTFSNSRHVVSAHCGVREIHFNFPSWIYKVVVRSSRNVLVRANSS